MSEWVYEVRQLPATRFIDLAQAPNLTGMDTAEIVRRELITYGFTPQGRAHETWQEAWNALTSATPLRPGSLVIRFPTCPTCHGRGYSFNGRDLGRSLSRGMPQGTCPECRGTRTLPSICLTAYAAEH